MRGRDIAIIVVVVVLVILVLGLASAMGPGMMGYYGYPFGYGNYWWFVVMGVAMFIFWVLVIGGIVYLIVEAFRRGGPTREIKPSPTPLDILRERYARGEITREQYEQMRRDLQE